MTERKFPELVAAVNQLEYPYGDEGGIDYEPYEEFQSAESTTEWIRGWTGDASLTGEKYRFFGMDGTGGEVGFWLVSEGVTLLEQPVVHFGSEGEIGVVAVDFADYLWLLAGGVGPMEAVEYGAESSKPLPDFVEFATKHAPNAKKGAAEVVSRAQNKYPTFVSDFMALVKH